MSAEEDETNLDYLESFLAQLGVEDTGSIFAQLSSEYGEEELEQFAGNPAVYEGLAQLASDYMDEELELAQVNTEEALF